MIKRVAVVDIGSNSVRLLISELIEKKNYKILIDEKDTIRLGREVFEKGVFGSSSIRRIKRTLEKFKKIMDDYEVDHVRVVATAAFREAANAVEVKNFISKETGIKNIEIISGKEEGRLIFLGVISNFDLKDKQALIVDIGGGSCELVIGDTDKISYNESLNLGGTRLTKFFLKSNPVKSYELEMLENHLDSVFKRIKLAAKKHDFDMIIGTGGSLNNFTKIIHALDKSNGKNDMFREVELNDVEKLCEDIASKTFRQRLKLPGLDKKRVDIILAAGLVIKKVMKFYGKNAFTSLSKGLKDGLMIDTINRLGIIFPYQHDSELLKEHRIWEIGHRYNFEEKHAENVTELSIRLFEQLKDDFGFDERWHEYLMAAAMLHDIGYYISHSAHHKHSQYLIENSDLIGYDEREKDIIAQIARYHRKSLPKKTHQGYQNLNNGDKEIVNKLASVLRIADAMDRSHLETIHDFRVSIKDNELIIKVNAPESDLFFEIEGVSKKGDMFTWVFDKKVVLKGIK